MTLRLIRWNTSDGKQVAIGDCTGDDASIVWILPETDADGLTSGQLSVKHDAKKGTEPGTWTD